MRKYEDLSPYEFQALVADLLDVEEGRTYERFRGPDGGVDLRWSRLRERHIVQCKNYRGSTWSQLKTSLKSEVTRVGELKPTTYRVVTSLGLTPARKALIQTMFKRYMPDSSYVIGGDDLDGLLDRHPEVERRHVKLWLSSSAVLDQILHNASYQRSRALLEDVKRALPTYVDNRSFTRAWKTLRNHRVCVISGPAGIGKTTLAKMLLARAALRRYVPIHISEDIEEAWSLFKPDERQVFYYDDFLGRTNVVEKLGKNEDIRLTSLIEEVRRSKNKLLIMTTRQYILEQARQTYENLRRLDLKRLGYLLQLTDYSRLERGRILFNHLYHSAFSTGFRREAAKPDAVFA